MESKEEKVSENTMSMEQGNKGTPASRRVLQRPSVTSSK